MLRLLAAAAFVASVSVSCSEISFIEINPPADLQEKIDAIQAEKDAANALLGDKTPIDIATPIVGAEDCTSAFFTAFSDYFSVSQKKCLTLEFVNHGSGASNWNNWNMCVATGERDKDGYSEFFVLRADAYGWGNKDYNDKLIVHDYVWDTFIADVQGAEVILEVDYSYIGTIFVTATTKTTSGSVYTMTYEQPVTGTDVNVFLFTDMSCMEMKAAYIQPSKIEEIPDENATSITVAGTPATIEVGSEDFWGKGVATVTFTDGSSTQVDTADVNFVVPDLTTVGTKTILYSYSKTKQGNYGPSVAGYYTLQVVNPIVKIEPSDVVVKLIGDAKYFTLAPGVMKVKATYSDGTTTMLTPDLFTIDTPVFEGKVGTFEYSVSCVTASGNKVVGKANVVVSASDLPAQTQIVGLEDNTTPWFPADMSIIPEGKTIFSQDWPVKAGETQVVSMTLRSAEGGNWHSPSIMLRKADLSSYIMCRMDNYGWDPSWEAAVKTCDWNFDTFQANLDGAMVSISVTNCGDNTASIRYYVILDNDEVHFQYYDNIAIDSADMQFMITTECAHLIFD